jgi:hypothetical protein
MRKYAFLAILGFAGCFGGATPPDTGARSAVDAGAADTGHNRTPPDAGFGGGLGQRCQRSSDCFDPTHRCYVGSYPNTFLRCTHTCGRDEDCYPFAEAAGLTHDEAVCEIPANTAGTRSYCVQKPPPPPDGGVLADVAGDVGGDVGDIGPRHDAGPGQAPGSRCTSADQCRGLLCVQGFSGDSFCSQRCETDIDCVDYAARAGLTERTSACVAVAGQPNRVCNEVASVPRPGWSARLPRGLNEVRARATLGADRSVVIRDFYYDGQSDGQQVFIGLSLGPITAEGMVPISIDLRCRGGVCGAGHPCAGTNGVCHDADLTLTIPAGLGYSDFDRIAIVGMPQGIAWSEGIFAP